MDSFLTELIRFNQDSLQNPDVAAQGAASESADKENRKHSLTTLAIARACLARLNLQRSVDGKELIGGKEGDRTSHPLQIVVAGPTQVGKSTLANLLLQQSLAVSSAEAGFTVHCQGFHVVDESLDRYKNTGHWASEYFTDLHLAAQSTLDRQALGEYSLQETVTPDSIFCDMVIWDTPDFDSIRSFDYRAPLVKSIALADLLVFVVSKEKYADKTVWIMLELLAELSIPVVVVMNKTPPAVRDELKVSFETKYQMLLSDRPELQQALPELVFLDAYPGEVLASVSPSDLEVVNSAVLDNLSRVDSEVFKDNTLTYFKHHWDDWTASVSSAHRKHNEYKDLVEKVCADTLQRYRREYIDSDRHCEVMQLALSELLVLLEVPGMAKPLGKIRSVVTWPVRTLLSSAKASSPVLEDDRNEERRLLDELGKHATASLSTAIATRETGVDKNWWRQLRTDLTEANNDLNSKYSQALDNYQALLQVEIDRAAQSLYRNLQQQPATLNGLRAARVTADAAAVVLAVKSGGLGAVDLVVAPAMLSLTTLLTEGALGKYMDRIQSKLTAYQEREMRSVIERKLRRPLLQLARHHHDQTLSEERLLQMSLKLESGDV